MSIKIKKFFGKSKSLGKESRDADRTEGLWGTSPEDERASFRGSSMTLPSNPEDATSFPNSLPTSPSEKKKKRFPTWRSKNRNKDKQFLTSSGELDSMFNHRWGSVISFLMLFSHKYLSIFLMSTICWHASLHVHWY